MFLRRRGTSHIKKTKRAIFRNTNLNTFFDYRMNMPRTLSTTVLNMKCLVRFVNGFLFSVYFILFFFEMVLDYTICSIYKLKCLKIAGVLLHSFVVFCIIPGENLFKFKLCLVPSQEKVREQGRKSRNMTQCNLNNT